jgi:lysophospholipase L1-like esterase
LRFLYVMLAFVFLATGALSQEFCLFVPPPPSKVQQPAPDLPTDFRVQQREGNAAKPALLFVGDSLVGGIAAAKVEDRMPFKVAESLRSNHGVIALSLSGRTSGFIAERFRAYNTPKNPILIVWVGRNGGASDPERVVSDIGLIVEHAKTQKFLVLSVPSNNYEAERPGSEGRAAIDALNDYLSKVYGEQFVRVANDTNCNDRDDFVHFTASGQAKIASTVAAAIRARSWD